MGKILCPIKGIYFIKSLIRILLLSIVFFTFFSCGTDTEIITIPCVDTNCADYTSQAAAQSAFDRAPDCRGDLDADNDGIACEEPGNSVTICPQTTNCGCSGINKTPCEASLCCRWVVGEGCKCR